jgi:hypothetical protein
LLIVAIEEPTIVLQLNYTVAFRHRLESKCGKEGIAFFDAFMDKLKECYQHPVTNRTICWLRATHPEGSNYIVINEIQSDLLNKKLQKKLVTELRANPRYKPYDLELCNKVLNELTKQIGLWEVDSIKALKHYAKQVQCPNIYMLPGDIKSVLTDRSYSYSKGHDTALEQIYDKIPPMVGFEKVSIDNVDPELAQLAKKVLKTASSIWYCSLSNLRTGSVLVNFARSLLKISNLLGVNRE